MTNAGGISCGATGGAGQAVKERNGSAVGPETIGPQIDEVRGDGSADGVKKYAAVHEGAAVVFLLVCL